MRHILEVAGHSAPAGTTGKPAKLGQSGKSGKAVKPGESENIAVNLAKRFKKPQKYSSILPQGA